MSSRRRGLSAFTKTTLRGIRGSAGRFLAILGIVALGCGFFAGLKMSGPTMRKATDDLYDGTCLYDLRLVSTLGFEDADVARVARMEGVQDVMPARSCDVVARMGGEQLAMRVGSLNVDAAKRARQVDASTILSDDSSYLNRVFLREGRWPEQANECVITADDQGLGVGIGDTVEVLTFAGDNDDALRERTLSVVGTVSSSAYPYTGSYGSTTLGSGKIKMYAFVGDDAFDEDLPYTEVYVRVAGAEREQAGSEAYEAVVGETRDRIDAATDELACARLEDLRSEAQAELDDARAEYEDKRADVERELADAKAELDDGLAELERGERELVDGQREYEEGLQELEDARAQLDEAEGTLEDSRAQLDDADSQLREGQSTWRKGMHDLLKKLGIPTSTSLRDARTRVEEQKKELVEGRAKLEEGIEQATEGERQAQEGIAQLEAGIAQIEEQIALLPEGEQRAMLEAQRDAMLAQLEEAQAGLRQAQETKAKLEEQLKGLPTVKELDQALEGIGKLEKSRTTLEESARKLEDGRRQLAEGEEELEAGKAQLEEGQAEADSAADELASGWAELADGRAEYEDGLDEYESGRREANEKLEDARRKIDDAQKEIDDLELPSIYLLDHSQNEGIAAHDADSKRIDSIANVFPLIFFLVAALVSLTTMTRMVGDDRTEIGTYKALGYGTARIASKYLFYAGAAGVAGATLGILVLSQVLPLIVTSAYSIIYAIPVHPLPLPIDVGIALVSGGLGVGVTLVATYGAVVASLREVPATLMLPRAPVAGKRILLERIGPVWRRLSFLGKVTCRNLFRYKRRFAMTVIGISGCTALLLVGFGLRDAIWDIIDCQFGPIVRYDTTVVFDSDATQDQVESVVRSMQARGDVHNIVRVQQENMHAGATSRDREPTRVQVIVPQSEESIANVVTMVDRLSREPVRMDDDAVVLTEKVATMHGLAVGDEILLYDQDDIGNVVGHGHHLAVTGITENYVGNIVYVGRNAWKAVDANELPFSTVLADSVDSRAARKEYSSWLHGCEGVSTVVFSDETVAMYRDALSVVDMVVVLLIVSAGLLALIVLYNLTNINISERVREIASLKVLGFTRGEVYAYVFREILLLSVIGDALGMVLGTFLETFVATTAETDYVMFGRVIHPMSYVYAFVLTIVFTLLILLLMRRKLDQVDMVESLKSIE